ncbi:hypothetical protein EV356DRAFT_318343 [Viridothelium virens]|uniref:Uncharacterized protein n=1 Tax=Viridothelium virens TaxID=1048519 RepID=A0A6A6GZ30_VIRVR|nr:hypothetical protein EV356DRAFT_318343 [Viridothelium virens]
MMDRRDRIGQRCPESCPYQQGPETVRLKKTYYYAKCIQSLGTEVDDSQAQKLQYLTADCTCEILATDPLITLNAHPAHLQEYLVSPYPAQEQQRSEQASRFLLSHSNLEVFTALGVLKENLSCKYPFACRLYKSSHSLALRSLFSSSFSDPS